MVSIVFIEFCACLRMFLKIFLLSFSHFLAYMVISEIFLKNDSFIIRYTQLLVLNTNQIALLPGL